MVAGAIPVLCSVGPLGGSGVALWAQTNRHGGYADLATATYSVPGYAIASDTVSLHLGSGAASGLIGTVRIRVSQASRTTPAFVGIAPASAAARYLARVDYATVSGATITMAPTSSIRVRRPRSRRAGPASGPRMRPGRVPRPSPGRCAAATGWWSP